MTALEHPREAGGETNLGIPRRQPKQDAAVEPHAGVGIASAEAQQAAVFRAWRGGHREVGAADKLAHHFGLLTHRARDRQVVEQQVVLRGRPRGIAEHQQADVADHAHRLDGLGQQDRGLEVLHVFAQARLVAGIRQSRGKARGQRRPARRFTHEPHLGADVHVLQIVSGVAVEQQQVGKRRRGHALGDFQLLIAPDMHLNLGNRAHAQADPECRYREEVTAQAGHRVCTRRADSRRRLRSGSDPSRWSRDLRFARDAAGRMRERRQHR